MAAKTKVTAVKGSTAKEGTPRPKTKVGAELRPVKFKDPRILVTAALPYVNGPLHIGHLHSTYIPADIFVRYLRLKRAAVVFVCASDEYGTPTVVAAEQEGLSPQQLVDKYHESAKRNFAAFALSFDIYSRTSNQASHELTQEIFHKLLENNFLFREIVKEYYCAFDKKFLPDRYVRGVCPKCGAKDQYADYCESCGTAFKVGDLLQPYCTISGHTPELRDSEHFVFKLSAFGPKLKFFLENARIKDEVRNYVLKWIEEGLKDWDIVRDLGWGVPVPGMAGKVFYVWFNAPIGYISATRDWAEKYKDPDEWKKYWILSKGADKAKVVHFIGKDIVYHHCLFWPAMLIGAVDFKVPDEIHVRGHVTLQGKKISKSRRWYILLDDYIKSWPADYLRFYYSLITPNVPTDSDFDWRDFQKKTNTELLGNVGNFIHRALTFIAANFGSEVPKGAGEPDVKERIRTAVVKVDNLYSQVEIDKAVKEILELAAFLNQKFQAAEPWKDPKSERTARLLYNCANAARTLAILLAPIIPDAAERLWSQLGLHGSVHAAAFDSAATFEIAAGHKIGKTEPLFKKVEDAAIKAELEKLEKQAAEAAATEKEKKVV